MVDASAIVQKQAAIEQHSLQAEEFADRYERLQANPYRSCFTYSRRRLEQCLQGILPADGTGMTLLDVGCGTGHHLAELRGRGFTVAGIDGSEEMLQRARCVNPGADLRQGDVEKLPFADQTFDYVVCIEVLRYLPDASRCIAEMFRVLKPGGHCVVTAMPLYNLNGYWLVNRLAPILRLKRFVHLKQFFTTAGELESCFTRAGFEKPEIRGVYYGPINWLERLTPSLLPGVLRRWEAVDDRLCRSRLLVDMANMYLVHARRPDKGKT